MIRTAVEQGFLDDFGRELKLEIRRDLRQELIVDRERRGLSYDL